jgi:AcrR family transcriptional regulator
MHRPDPDKKRKIIEAARARFRYYGIAKTTMQEIAQDAGVAVGTLYLYFSNKDELIVAGAEDFVERHRREAEVILAGDTPADQKLRDYVLARFRHAAETRTSSRHAAEITRAVLRVRPDRIQEEGMLMWEIVTRLLALGAVQGILQVPRPEEDAKVFLYSIAFFFPNALSEPAIEPQEAELLSVVDWFLNSWRVAPSKRSPKVARKRRK